jgi:hypothetical protein
MNRIVMGIAMAGPMVLSTYAPADEQRAVVGKHQMLVQLVDCVKKRVASRTASYGEAIKACREEVREQAAGSPPETLLASGVHTKS